MDVAGGGNQGRGEADGGAATRPGAMQSLSFNQDGTCVAVGTSTGYRVFACAPAFAGDVFHPGGGVGVAEMLFCTSLVALVGGGPRPAFSPRRLKLWHARTRRAICELGPSRFCRALFQIDSSLLHSHDGLAFSFPRIIALHIPRQASPRACSRCG